MNHHGKKMVAPILIAGLFVLYYAGLAAVLVLADGIPAVFKVLSIIIPLALAGVMAGVAVSRIKEIRSGEEDDLSKY